MSARDNFEEPDFNRKYEPVQKDDLSGVDLIFPNQSPKGPIEDPVNQDPWVLVVDGKQFPARGATNCSKLQPTHTLSGHRHTL